MEVVAIQIEQVEGVIGDMIAPKTVKTLAEADAVVRCIRVKFEQAYPASGAGYYKTDITYRFDDDTERRDRIDVNETSSDVEVTRSFHAVMKLMRLYQPCARCGLRTADHPIYGVCGEAS